MVKEGLVLFAVEVTMLFFFVPGYALVLRHMHGGEREKPRSMESAWLSGHPTGRADIYRVGEGRLG